MPRGRSLFPSDLRMYRRRTGFGRYSPSRSSVPRASRKLSTPCCSIAASVSRSTPAAPRFFFTRFQDSWRTSLRQIRSINAWKRRFGSRLADTHSRRCSCRTLSVGLHPPGWLDPVLPVMPSHLPAIPTRPKQGPFPLTGLFVPVVFGTTAPSDSRCATLDFVVDLYEPPCPDKGCADGPLVFRTAPSPRAAPHTPERPFPRSGSGGKSVAFAMT